MIRYTKGEIFDAQTEAIVNTVNTVGVMGKGLALQFKKRFPDNFEVYKKACDNKRFHIGDLLITNSNSLFFKYIINFPTKEHWRYPSKYEYIERGLEVFTQKIQELNILSVAIPPLGAGNGKLDWNKVKSILEGHLKTLPEIEFIIDEPQSRFDSRDNSIKRMASLTPIRALLLQAFADYEQVDASLNLLVAQKLSYFLQRFGEPLRLKYQKGWYGPYAANLNKVLQAINGTYIKYEAQKDKPDTRIYLIPEKQKEILAQWRKLSHKQKERAKLLKSFVTGFETPFSLELLATVDWILQQNPTLNSNEIYNEIGNWTKRKSELIKPYHVRIAYQHLQDYQDYLN